MKKLLPFLFFALACQLSAFAQGNFVPSSAFTLNNKPYTFNTIIELFPGDTMSFVVNTTDPNATDSLSVSSDIASILPGAIFSVNNAKRPTASIFWIPSAADARLEPYTISIRIEDNSYPIKSVQIDSIKIRVNGPQAITLNNGSVDLNQEIELMPGNPFNFRVSSAFGFNSIDSISISSDANMILPGAVFTTDNAKQQTATINWTPTAAHIRANAYNFKATLTEKSATGMKQYVYSVNVRVGNVMAVKSEPFYEQTFTAYPNPFSEHITFNLKSKATSILIYNLLGQQIDEIQLKTVGSGGQKVQWQNAQKHAAGIYIARLISENKTIQTLKFTKVQ